jgi:hypothetical protein
MAAASGVCAAEAVATGVVDAVGDADGRAASALPAGGTDGGCAQEPGGVPESPIPSPGAAPGSAWVWKPLGMPLPVHCTETGANWASAAYWPAEGIGCRLAAAAGDGGWIQCWVAAVSLSVATQPPSVKATRVGARQEERTLARRLGAAKERPIFPPDSVTAVTSSRRRISIVNTLPPSYVQAPPLERKPRLV